MPPSETPTETLQITLPTELAERIRQRVRTGHFADESELIATLFLDKENAEDTEDWSDLPPTLMPFDPENPSISGTEEDWLTHVVRPRLLAWEAGDRKTYSLAEVRQHMEALFHRSSTGTENEAV